jgi:meso-butanediol dehydrogenase / (S,S)-butanediol dehydrogenase / diacetyl reductase
VNFSGKVAIVTGGASGIGRATSLEFLNLGAAVAVVDRDETSGRKLVQEAGDERLRFFPADVSSDSQVQQLIPRIVEAFGGIDVLASNAGIQTYGSATTTSEAEWDKTLAANLKSGFLVSKYSIPHMIKRGGGSIVITASVQSLGAQRNSLAYVVSKHALIGLMRSLALDYAKDNIRVNAVCPGAIDTPMLRWAASLDPDPDRVIAACHKMHPLGHMGKPEEVARVIAFLASDLASFVTGTAVTVDGGLMIPIGGMSFQESGTGAKKA